jgi:hypothetical protein
MEIHMRAWLSKVDSSATLIATAIIIACTALLLRQRAPSPLVGELVPATAGVQGKYRLVTVFQLGDCDSRLDFLTTLQTSRIAGMVDNTLLFVGSDRDYADVRKRLSTRVGSVAVSRASSRTIRQLRPFGYAMTPFTIVLDPQGRVRLTLPTPEAASAVGLVESSLRQLVAVDSAGATPSATAAAVTVNEAPRPSKTDSANRRSYANAVR